MNKSIALICLALAAPLAPAAGAPRTPPQPDPAARDFADDRGGPDWDVLTPISGYGTPPQCGPGRCGVVIRYRLNPPRPSDEPARPRRKEGEEKARYLQFEQGGGWKVDSGSLREPRQKPR
ncbi:hypothetical protein CXB49_08065 [Chromobacterium sp. ATCC 53434]|uniref:hypothetical protein n=1 Tax=Chromobacterium sp. (strain ATCC 53434 / SC 14030) TaxID=2059672 RepID=UPI000C77D931|nr:hypothetical protein [Chromobacterium sp. ATCC 53434]AUH50760.1 hypothetical protein CXB49_08065 [Chromobacterium sp. ATCC 53434]